MRFKLIVACDLCPNGVAKQGFRPIGLPGCAGCLLAVHTWNVADRVGATGLRLHGHLLPSRAAFFTLEWGLLRLQGHADGRGTALGGYVAVAGSVVAVGAAASLWRWEQGLLRVASGERCGAVLALTEERDERSVYAVVTRLAEQGVEAASLRDDTALGTVLSLLPGRPDAVRGL